MKPVTAVILAMALSVFARADEPTQADVDQLRGLVDENFAACNREDVKGVLATFHPGLPPELVAELKQEAEKCFDETDVRVRLVKFHVNYWEDPTASGRVRMAAISGRAATADAEVVQLTLPSDHSYADLDEYPAQLSTDFRNQSALLPKHQLVEYTVRYWYDYKARKWKMAGIISPVRPLHEWPQNIREIMRGEPVDSTCRGGVCPSPMVNSGRR